MQLAHILPDLHDRPLPRLRMRKSRRRPPRPNRARGLRLRPRRDLGRRDRSCRRSCGWVSGIRLLHGLAPGDRGRHHRPGERPVRTDAGDLPGGSAPARQQQERPHRARSHPHRRPSRLRRSWSDFSTPGTRGQRATSSPRTSTSTSRSRAGERRSRLSSSPTADSVRTPRRVPSLGRLRIARWMRGDRGRIRIEILLNPELPPRIQSLTVIGTNSAEPA